MQQAANEYQQQFAKSYFRIKQTLDFNQEMISEEIL